MYCELRTLVGKKIQTAYWTGGSIRLTTLEGDLGLEPYGECCADCFITDIDGANALFDATVLKIEDLETYQAFSNSYDVIETWGHRIHTDKGICTIGMRVEHNGYYGGSLYVETNPTDKPQIPLADFTR